MTEGLCHYCHKPTDRLVRFADCVVRPYCGCQDVRYEDTRTPEQRRMDRRYSQLARDPAYAGLACLTTEGMVTGSLTQRRVNVRFP